jgi:hypothetical protein
MRLIDLTGIRFGKLVVIYQSSTKNVHGQIYWTCQCDCGTEKEILGYNLRHGHSTSCGCGQRTAARNNIRAQHIGEANRRAKAAKRTHKGNYVSSRDSWYRAAAGRFYHARVTNTELGFDSIHEFATYCKSIAPTHCPILGIELTRGDQTLTSNFSIDRIDNSLGYIKGNIQIISNRANRLKSDASKEELYKLAKWVLHEDDRSGL